MDESSEKKRTDQLAAQDVRRFIARTVLTLSNELRKEADALCAAHLKYDRPQLPPR